MTLTVFKVKSCVFLSWYKSPDESELCAAVGVISTLTPSSTSWRWWFWCLVLKLQGVHSFDSFSQPSTPQFLLRRELGMFDWCSRVNRTPRHPLHDFFSCSATPPPPLFSFPPLTKLIKFFVIIEADMQMGRGKQNFYMSCADDASCDWCLI